MRPRMHSAHAHAHHHDDDDHHDPDTRSASFIGSNDHNDDK